jgi:hypothetical protein
MITLEALFTVFVRTLPYAIKLVAYHFFKEKEPLGLFARAIYEFHQK